MNRYTVTRNDPPGTGRAGWYLDFQADSDAMAEMVFWDVLKKTAQSNPPRLNEVAALKREPFSVLLVSSAFAGYPIGWVRIQVPPTPNRFTFQ